MNFPVRIAYPVNANRGLYALRGFCYTGARRAGAGQGRADLWRQMKNFAHIDSRQDAPRIGTAFRGNGGSGSSLTLEDASCKAKDDSSCSLQLSL